MNPLSVIITPLNSEGIYACKYKIALLATSAGCLLAFNLHAQDAPAVILPATELENFELQTNTIIVRGFSLVGTVTLENNTLSVHSQEANDVSHSQKAYGIVVELSGASQADSPGKNFAGGGLR